MPMCKHWRASVPRQVVRLWVAQCLLCRVLQCTGHKTALPVSIQHPHIVRSCSSGPDQPAGQFLRGAVSPCKSWPRAMLLSTLGEDPVLCGRSGQAPLPAVPGQPKCSCGGARVCRGCPGTCVSTNPTRVPCPSARLSTYVAVDPFTEGLGVTAVCTEGAQGP